MRFSGFHRIPKNAHLPPRPLFHMNPEKRTLCAFFGIWKKIPKNPHFPPPPHHLDHTGGSIYRPGVKKLGYFYTFSAPKAPKTCFLQRRRCREKFLSTFFEIFGKFVNKNAIKSDFWGVVCRYISKISKKSLILGKKYFYTRTKISKVLLQRWGHPTPKNICAIYVCISCHLKTCLDRLGIIRR